MSITIKLRRGNAANWSSQNIVLASGEPGYEIDTGRLKIGDGSSAWNSLSYASIVPSGFLSGSGVSINLGTNGASATIGVSGLNSSYIGDFNTAVSGLLPVKDILSGTGISVSSSSGIYTITSTGSGIIADQANQAASIVTTVFNKTASTIPKMSAVYINGGQGDQPTIQLAIATGDLTSAATYGITYEAISSMSTGKVIVLGSLSGVNTDQFNPTAPTGNVNGTIVYLSPSVSGALTTTKPYAPNHLVSLGTIVRTHQNEGVIEVRVQNGFELEELHNVAATGASNNQAIIYNSASGLWINTTLTSSLISDFNEAVDDRVGSGLFVAGTGINLNYNDGGNSFTVGVTGLINNPANNRILTSRDNTTTGIDAESNLTYDGNFIVNGSTISGASTSSILAGIRHLISGVYISHNSICGGDSNKIYSTFSTIANGFENIASGALSFIGNGFNNKIYNSYGSILNGINNISSGQYSSILGGQSNNDGGYNNVFILGSNITGTQANTTYVQNLRASATGNFVALQVNGTGVSISGHTHTSSDIINFNSAVSGLLPTISNSGNDRILTSTGSSVGVNAESNLTFDGTNLVITSGLTASTGNFTTSISGALLDIDNIRIDGNTISSTNTNGNIIIQTNGIGALQRDSGGNTRGQYAVDWQNIRSTGTMVAIGSNSVIGGGSNNTVNSSLGTIAGGNSNSISSNFFGMSTICGGNNNAIIGDWSFIGGGSANKIYKDYATIGGGYYNIASGISSFIAGGAYNTTRGTSSSILGGYGNNDGGFSNVFILGSNLTASQADTTFVQNLDVASTGDIDTLRINKFYHNNLSVATGVADSDLLVAIVNPTGVSSTQVISGSGLRNSLLNQPAALRFRQGTNAERLLITPASGEPIWTTDTQQFFIGDGSTVGGDFMGPSPYSGVSLSIVPTFGNCSVSGSYGLVSAGLNNIAGGAGFNSITCGYNNTIGGNAVFSSIVGGSTNTIRTGDRSFIGGGSVIAISGGDNVIVGGGGHLASGTFNFIGGGSSNYTINAVSYSTIAGGRNNTISSGNYTVICGGSNNVTSGTYSSILGGSGNNDKGYSNVFILGSSLTATQADTTYVQNLIASSTGNFNALQVNGTGVSVSGHTHTASQITDFNEAVDDRIGSGLFVAGTGINLSYNDAGNSFTISVTGLINNPSDNRILTSRDSTTTGIDAESNLTFDSVNFNLKVGGSSNGIGAGTTYSSILGGNINNIGTSGTYNTICGGAASYTLGSYSFIGGGVINAIGQSSSSSVIAGGLSNSIPSGINYVSIVGGEQNVGSGIYSSIPGGLYAKTTRYGELSHSAGRFAAAGDAQHTTLIARKTTTDATANQVLFLDNSSARLTLPAKTTWTFSIKLSAYNDTDSAAAGWIYRGVIKRDGSNNTSLVGTVIEENWKDTSMNSTSASIVADDTNEALEIRVTGLASKNIRWVAVVDLSQVSYGTP